MIGWRYVSQRILRDTDHPGRCHKTATKVRTGRSGNRSRRRTKGTPGASQTLNMQNESTVPTRGSFSSTAADHEQTTIGRKRAVRGGS
jgi:hypothetical protein